MKQINYTCPYWGQEGTRASMFLARVIEAGYDGVEINVPDEHTFVSNFQSSVSNIRSVKPEFAFIAQHVLDPATESVTDHIARVKKRLEYLVTLKPDFINIHTGKDHYSFEDNCKVIEVVEAISAQSSIPVLHETHRSRFAFHPTLLLPYLDKFPQLKLTGDFSHWCVVSESMLTDQRDAIQKIIPHVHHIHARVGHEQAPQVNDPFAPEWARHTDTFVNWWKEIIACQADLGKQAITITPEFGPTPYMPVLPYSQRPVIDQWQLNVQMKEMLKRRLNIKPVFK